jgi:hypothetical protein
MAKTNLKFYGLCGVGKINGTFQAAMPSVMNHVAVLAARIDQIDTSVSNKPDMVFNGVHGIQIGLWDLGNRTLTFDGASGEPTWANNEQKITVNLAELNQGSVMKAPGNAAVVKLPAGTLSTGKGVQDLQSYKILKGTQPLEERKCALAIEWKGTVGSATATLKGGGLTLAFFDGAAATITNIMKEKGGEKHFVHYYDEFFVTRPANDKLISIENLQLEVFDCVPPVPLP